MQVMQGHCRMLTLTYFRLFTPALPLRLHIATSTLAAPGINIDGYSRFEAKSNLLDSALEMAVRPLQQHTNTVSRCPHLRSNE